MKSEPFRHVHGRRDDHGPARGDTPGASLVIGDRASFQGPGRVVIDGTEKFEIFGIVGIPEHGFFVQEGDVALFFEAHEGAGVLGVGVPVGAANSGSVGAAEFAEFVRVVTLNKAVKLFKTIPTHKHLNLSFIGPI